jgi:primosomal replication protein N
VNSNQLALSGVIASSVRRQQTPSGIATARFLLEHRSEQEELGMRRQAWCRIPVWVAGNELVAKAQAMATGDAVHVSGFLTQHRRQGDTTVLVLHARTIEPH